ncbi:hypothetical protein BDW22DRAFT_1186151 [Trametopsis cervina]|nr:hypothetical protein BDW22DRAFT_1186151 [Trametopsis cervina]
MTIKVSVVTALPASAPLYPSMEFYPTSPLQIFPPPMPSRQSLRSRCGVTMRLQLTTNVMGAGGWSTKGHVQPHRHNLPRRRNPKRVVLHEDVIVEVPEKKVAPAVEKPKVESEAKVAPLQHSQPQRNNLPRRRRVNRMVVHDTEDDVAQVATIKPVSERVATHKKTQAVTSYPPIEVPYVPTIPTNDAHLQILIPGVAVTFGDNIRPEQLPGDSSEEPYTHVVHIHQNHTDEPASRRETQGKTQIMHLHVSSSANAGTTRAGLALTDAQLRAARDFMAEALPHPETPKGVSILVLGPHGRPTDIMCVAACYLAFVSGKSTEEVLLFIDAEEEYLSAWKGEVTEDESEKVEQIARAWSWLSNIVTPPARG